MDRNAFCLRKNKVVLIPCYTVSTGFRTKDLEGDMKGFQDGYALLVGVDESKVPDYALPDVKKDVQALANVLTSPDRCAYAADHVRVLTGKKASRSGVMEGLSWLRKCIQDAQGEVTAVIYYSGHGMINKAADP